MRIRRIVVLLMPSRLTGKRLRAAVAQNALLTLLVAVAYRIARG